MSEPSPPRHSARETRLLLITLGVSVAALLLLARFRFPERPITDLTPPQPLTRLTRVTAFDELSALLRDLLRQFEGAVVSVRVVPADADAVSTSAAAGFTDVAHARGDAPGAAADSASRAGASMSLSPVGPLDALALVVADDIALVPLATGSRLLRVASTLATADIIVARDDERGLATVRLPGHSAPELQLTPAANPVGAPGYVAILEAAPDGPTIRAEFVSRVSRESHPAWDVPILALGGAVRTQPGAFLFTLTGRFIGMTLDDGDHTLVVPAETLLARASRLAQGESIRLIESGLGIQQMTPALATATGADAGIIVNAVSPSTSDRSGVATSTDAKAPNPANTPAPAASSAVSSPALSPASPSAPSRASSSTPSAASAVATIEVGDAIIAVNGQAIRSPREWQQALRARGPGATLELTIVRLGKRLQASWTLPRASTALPPRGASATRTASPASSSDEMAALGLSLRGPSSAGKGVEIIDVHVATPASRAGLRAGDVILSLPSRGAATQHAIVTAYTELPSGRALLVAIDRQGTPLVAAIVKP